MYLLRLLIIVVMLAGVGYGQGANTVYKTLATNLNVATGTALPTKIPNIGQIYHQLSVTFTNASGKVCSGSILNAGFLGSYDNVTYTPITQRFVSGGVSAGVYKTIIAVGLYPYIRVAIYQFDYVNCLATVNYSGSLYPVTVMGHSLYPFDQAGDLASYSQLPLGDVILSSSVAAERQTLMSMVLNNLADGNVITVYCSGGNTLLKFSGMTPGQTVVLPRNPDGMSYGICDVGQNLTVNSTISGGSIQITRHTE